MEHKYTKQLQDYKEEIHRCSKCGLCQSVCPIYKTTGNECTVSRGQFIMLDGVIKNKLKMSKTINKYLDICLKCNKCSGFCPSNIDILDIILCAKHEYLKNSVFGKIIEILESKYIFNTVLNTIGKILSIFSKQKISEKFETKAVYFGGCISKLNPKGNNFIFNVLNKANIEYKNINFNCCGMPFLTTGNLDRFKEQIVENIKRIPDDINLIITDCASCEWAWKQYSKYLDDKDLQDKLSKIKIKSIYQIIEEKEIKFSAKKTLSITYHKPCHEEHSQEILNIIKNIKNTTYIEQEGFEDCCGFSSLEAPQSLKTNLSIINKKRKNVLNTKTNYTLTSCAGCLIMLSLITFGKSRAERLITFLEKYCKID